MFALCDCNSFYASCERLFRPDLSGKPVVVLSNNDGCLIALTAEAKALGFKMGMPYFKVRDELKYKGVTVFSSNYPLYADLSNRVKTVLDELFPVQEIYSIDESFGTHIPDTWDCESYGQMIKETVVQCTGIPVAVGFGETRTLAKLANRWAKKKSTFDGVVSWSELGEEYAYELLQETPVEDVWGIGARIAQSLHKLEVVNAWQFMQLPEKTVRQLFNVTLLKTQKELWGESCLMPEDIESQVPKQVVSSRSFGHSIYTHRGLKEAIANFVSRAAYKLRRHDLRAHHLSVWIKTSRFNEREPYYAPMMSYQFPVATHQDNELAMVAHLLLGRMFVEGKEYKKAGIMLGDLVKGSDIQMDLFSQPTNSPVMAVFDAVNQRYGKGAFQLGSSLATTPWQMKQSLRSPSYTTRWQDLPSVR